MSRVRIVLAAVLAVSALAVMAVPASASVPAANAKFCKAYEKIGSGSNDGSTVNPSTAKTNYARFKAAAKYAPPKVKKAGEQIASVLNKVSKFSPTNASDLTKFYTSSDFKNYGKSITTFFLYATQQCT